MSIFGKIKVAKKAADDKKAKDSQSKPLPAPYRHVPTHAMLDALGGAPPRRHPEDRAAIRAAHMKRKSQLAHDKSGLSSTGASSITVQDSHRSHSSTGDSWSNMEHRKHHSRTQFQSLQRLTVPEDRDPGHTSDGSSSSRGSYLEIPFQQRPKRSNRAPKNSSTQTSKPRKLGEAPKRPPLTQNPVPQGDIASQAIPSDHSAPKGKKRRGWVPFGHSKAAAVAAH